MNPLTWLNRTALLAAATIGLSLGASPLRVVTTTTILDDIVREIGGDAVESRCLVPRGTDVHGFEPRPADVRALRHAAVVVVNGLGFDDWVERLIANSGFAGPIVRATRGIDPIQKNSDTHTHDHDHHHHTVDPHAWHDPRNGIIYVRNITEALVRAAPDRAEHFQSRAAELIGKLKSHDDCIRQQWNSIPDERRKIVTSHDSLAYYGQAYSVEVIAIAGMNPGHEPDARRMAALIDTIRQHRIRGIFVESVSNPKVLELIVRDAGARVSGELLTDSLALPGRPGDTYLSMLRTNTERLIEALR